ncbi:hypothetical protein [Clostridium pasteurianum]|uniref:hypothetical protein n=1 Tax=Clostridium pasteurianum TaxID=1501 RepID=UPI001FA8BA3A|nr:hypothetical protein [Clostridium pasteurianum]
MYTFFNTYQLAHKFDRGEILKDESIFTNSNIGFGLGKDNDNGFFKIIAWALIIVGILAIINKIFVNFQILYVLRSYIAPVLFIIIGLYLLLRRKK